ncbi:MAG: hypothetical protein H0U18_17045 [Pyrinomonadaceae bacterium]|nr:hypothetical protein [Pyrinomonadaceae bacterium]
MAKAKQTTGTPTRAGANEKPPLSDKINSIKGSRGDSVFEFTPNIETGIITARLSLSNGDSIGAQGATREEAVDNLEMRLGDFPK